MNVLLATSEAAPLAKTGGLADVCGALPAALARLGHAPTVIMPAHRTALNSGAKVEPLELQFDVPVGNHTRTAEVLRTTLPGDVPVYLVGNPEYFDRDGLYQDSNGHDFDDNCQRFVFFSRAVVEMVRLLNLRPDVIHCNDWQTGLIPAYMKTEYRHTPGYGGIGTLMTVHNMAYQGVFPHWDMQLTGLDWKYFNYHQMEFYGRLNLLKTGLVFADWLTTVSPRYAQEIQRGPLGCGLEGMLRGRSDTLTGIVNGVDYSLWDPRNDPHLARPYDTSCWRTTKPVCKAALQHELGLPEHPATPLLAFIGRFAAQKGFDLLAPLMRRWAATQDVQWAVLGTGELQYYDMLRDLTRQFPDRVAARLSFDDALAHRIEAGADMLVIPSQFEPCGLNQLYSLRYGTVPIVHATGGLADTICDATAVAFNQGAANGFLFHVYDEQHLDDALLRAVTMYRQPQRGWSRLVETGMRQDWSWDQSARQYAELYAAAQRRAAL